MARFQLVSAYINLAGSRDNVVFRGGSEAITYPEALVLQALHGGEEHVYEMTVVGSTDRDMADEYDRLQNTYGDVVKAVFPKIGNAASLPLGDDGLPTQEEVDAAQKAAADAREAIRAKATANTAKKAKAKADAAVAALDTEPAPAPDAVPSLADLPE